MLAALPAILFVLTRLLLIPFQPVNRAPAPHRNQRSQRSEALSLGEVPQHIVELHTIETT